MRDKIFTRFGDSKENMVADRKVTKVKATAEIGEAVSRGMVARRILDGIVRNVYKSNTGKIAAWTSASHVEKAPKKTETYTP